MVIVAKIHNNSLGQVLKVDNINLGIQVVRQMAEEQLGRTLNDEELEILENTYEVYNDEDSDNIFTWSIGITEN